MPLNIYYWPYLNIIAMNIATIARQPQTNLKVISVYCVILIHLFTEQGHSVSDKEMSDMLSKQVVYVSRS